MIRCRSCNQELPDEAHFCTECGKPVRKHSIPRSESVQGVSLARSEAPVQPDTRRRLRKVIRWAPGFAALAVVAVLLVYVTDVNTAILWMSPAYETHKQAVLAFTSDGPRVLCSGYTSPTKEPDKTYFACWDVQTGERLSTFVQYGSTGGSRATSIWPSGMRAVSSTWDRPPHRDIFHVWDINNGTKLYIIEENIDRIGESNVSRDAADLAISKDGKRIITATTSGLLRYYDADGGRLLKEFGAETDPDSLDCRHIALTSDGRQVLIARVISGENLRGESLRADWIVELWDIAAGSRVKSLRIADDADVNRTGIHISPDGRRCLLGHYMFDMEAFQPIYNLGDIIEKNFPEIVEHLIVNVNSVAFSPDGRSVLCGVYSGKLRLWDAESGQLLRSYDDGHTEPIICVAFSPDGRQILSGGKDVVLLRNSQTGTIERRLAVW